MFSITGPIFAIVTPFDKTLQIDEGALTDYLAFLWQHGVRNIIVNGTTAEFPSLTFSERKRMTEICREAFPGVIINHISSCAIQDSLDLSSHSNDFADALLLLPPYYYASPEKEGILAFYDAILPNCSLPVYLYNFPRHTQAPITDRILTALVNRYDNIAGIKDSGGNINITESYKFSGVKQIFVGADRMALDVLDLGFSGSVTGLANPIPENLTGLHAAYTEKQREKAQQYQHTINAWVDIRETIDLNEIGVVKAGLSNRIAGFPIYTRAPLVNANEDAAAKIKTGLAQIL